MNINVSTKHTPHTLIPKLVANYGFTNVLDVGCGHGEILHTICTSGISGVGCELDSTRAESAKQKGLTVYNGDVHQNEIWEKLKKHACFDCLILADVIEHLYQPQEVINNAKALLGDKGNIIISLPNVAHYAVRYHLGRGNFEYTDYGVLDRTHVRFFTLDTACKYLANDLGLVVEDIWALLVFPQRVKRFLFSDLKESLGRKWPNLYGQQFVFKTHV